MLLSSLRRAGSVLFFLSIFCIDEAFGRGGRGGGEGEGGIGGGGSGAGAGAAGGSAGGGGGGGGGGGSIGNDGDGFLNLSSGFTAIFSFTIIIAVITLYPLGYSAAHLKKPVLPKGEPTLPYDVGLRFRILLSSYLFTYLITNILYAIAIAFGQGSGEFVLFPIGLGITLSCFGQLADVLLFATILSVIAHRQRIQLNRKKQQFDLKSFFDGCMLLSILVLGIVQDAVSGAASPTPISNPSDQGTDESLDKKAPLAFAGLDITVTFQAFVYIMSLYMAVSALMAHIRLKQSGIQDRIIWIANLLISPAMLISATYRVFAVSLARRAADISRILWLTRSPTAIFDGEGLLMVGTIVDGIVSIFVIACCLFMGAPLLSGEDKNHKV